MKSTSKVACALLAFALTCGLARAGSADGTTYSNSELKKMVRDANTPEQYRVLASYYRVRQQRFTEQAHDEIVWFAKRQLNLSLPAAKYPTPLDSSRNRYEYFRYEAQQMGEKAAHFESLAAGLNP